jgi:hypothetical protein
VLVRCEVLARYLVLTRWLCWCHRTPSQDGSFSPARAMTSRKTSA